MTTVDKNGMLSIWVDYATCPIVEAARGSMRVQITISGGTYTTDQAQEIVDAINKAIRYAGE